jgi:FMN phosphatase YigB (HAD superfamily)
MRDFAVHGLIGLVAGLAAVVLWEVLGLREWMLGIVQRLKRRFIWKRFFALTGDVFVAQSPVPTLDNKPARRVADDVTMDLIRPKILADANLLHTDPGLSASHAAAHFVFIGSTRHLERTRDLQHWYELPFQYLFEFYHADPPRPLLKIVSSFGQEYASSLDIGRRFGNWPIDYGMLFIANVPHRKRIYWISGIHGPGTIGIAKYFTEHPAEFEVNESADTSWARQWLFRVEYDPALPESVSMIKGVKPISGPAICEPRAVRSRAIRAVICDFGNVLMTFDRQRTYRALGHACGRPFKDVETTLEKETAREAYERGAIDDVSFFESVRKALGTDKPLTLEMFSEWWGDIFWENRDVVQLFREIRDQVALVMLSNTNSLHMASVREHYPDVLSIFKGQVLSYEEKMLKPAPQLFQRAMALAGKDIRPEECIYIDDLPKYVDAAEKFGMMGHLYTSYRDLVRALRSVGVRIT